LEAALPALRKAGHAPSLALGLSNCVEARWNAAAVAGSPAASAEAMAREAAEALAAFDSEPVRGLLAGVALHEAGFALLQSDAEFARWLEGYRGLSPGALLPYYARRHPERAAALRERPEVRRVADAFAEHLRRGPRYPNLQAWAWLELAGHEARTTALEAMRASPVFLERELLDRLLFPGTPYAEIEAWLACTALGEKERADRIAAEARASKCFPPLFGE
jgi:hypothetical protein